MITQGLKYMFNSSSPFYMKPRLDLDFLRWTLYFKKSSTKAKVEKAMPVIRDINLLSRELYEGIRASGDLGDFNIGDQGLMMVYQTNEAFDHEMEVVKKGAEMGLVGKHLSKEELKKLEKICEQPVIQLLKRNQDFGEVDLVLLMNKNSKSPY